MIVSAKHVLPIDRPPLQPGWIEIEHGRIVAVAQGKAPAGAQALGDVALLPGLVNAHTHLELSWLAGRIRPAASFVEWVQALMPARLAGPPDGEDGVVRSARTAARSLAATGCVLVGDISNGLTTPAAIQAAGLGGVVFHELLGFNVSDPAGMVRDAARHVQRVRETLQMDGPLLRVGVTAHASYSTSPGLMREIVALSQPTPLTIHVAESADELDLLRTGSGAFRRLLEDFGAWDPAWQVPHCDPVEYLDDLGYLKPGLLAVHAVHLSDDAVEVLREAGGVIVTCPRSNEWVGGGIPRVAHFYAEDIPVAIGTDSLASCPSLNLFDELAELRRIAPDVAAASLLESATRVGAQALGFGADYGTLSPGKQAAIVAVNVPPGTSDVEEYLVSGVPARAVRLLRP